jgi:hypothetical protein
MPKYMAYEKISGRFLREISQADCNSARSECAKWLRQEVRYEKIAKDKQLSLLDENGRDLVNSTAADFLKATANKVDASLRIENEEKKAPDGDHWSIEMLDQRREAYSVKVSHAALEDLEYPPENSFERLLKFKSRIERAASKKLRMGEFGIGGSISVGREDLASERDC